MPADTIRADAELVKTSPCNRGASSLEYLRDDYPSLSDLSHYAVLAFTSPDQKSGLWRSPGDAA